MRNKILCILQARTGSTRLPNKVLKKVKGQSLLEYEIRRVRQSKKIDKIVVATTTNSGDDKIIKLCKRIKVDYFRGSEEDVLDRYYQCSLKFPRFQAIMRITGDCPLVDPQVIDTVINQFHQSKCDYASNVETGKETYPDGINAEVFKRSVLAEAAKKAGLPSDREHVNEYIFRNTKFKKKFVSLPYNFSHFRLTIDRKEDFEIIKFLIERSKITDSFWHYIALLTKNPKIMLKNRHIKRNENMPESLKKDRLFLKSKDKTVIWVMGGSLKKEAGGRWRTTNYFEGDKFGVIGDRTIVIAASLLYKENPGWFLIVSGGKGQNKNITGAPSVSRIVKHELIELGVPALCIAEESNSNNTYQQLQELQNIFKKKNFKQVAVISNKHGLPRIKAMIKYTGNLAELKKALESNHLKLLSAEQLLLKYQPDVWRKIIKKAYQSNVMKKRIKLEQQGVRQIKDGTYKFI